MDLLTKNTVKTFKSDGITSSKMGVDEDTVDLLTMYLRDKIYTDKILAPIREYICNAWDAHIESGNTDKCVEVRISKANSSYQWSVRDFGNGLDEDDIRNVFGIYGKSTKRNTNKLVGTFGVGAMSAFSYTDTFYVTSYFVGVKTTYVCSLGAGDYGVEVGEIHKISEEPTTENGIEISFDISNDYYSFNKKTTNFVRNFSPSANIRYSPLGEDIVVPYIPLITRNSSLEGVVFSSYANFQETPYILVRMGGVIYTTLTTEHTFKATTVVDIPIGAMSIPISRETFEDNPANNKYLKNLKDEIEQLYVQDINSIPKMSLMEYGKSSISNTYTTDFFELCISDAYPTHHKIWNHIRTSSPFLTSKISILETCAVVYVFPNILNAQTWHRRLFNFLKTATTNNPNYCHMDMKVFDSLKGSFDEIGSDMDIVFLKVKDMKLPKLVVSDNDKKQYAISKSGTGYRTTYYTLEELEAHVSQTSPIHWDSLDTKWWNREDLTRSDLLNRTIGMSNLPYGMWRCNSQKFVDMMVDIGWVSYGSEDYFSACNIITHNEGEYHKKRNMTYWIENHIFYNYWTPNTIKSLERNYQKNSERMDNLVAKLRTRKTTIKDKIIKSYVSSLVPYETPSLNRKEFRKLLTAKLD